VSWRHCRPEWEWRPRTAALPPARHASAAPLMLYRGPFAVATTSACAARSRRV
jgi:hypothetical protein